MESRVCGARRAGAVIGTCEPVIAELFFGVHRSATADENRKLLLRWLPELKCWPLSRGLGIGAMDGLIAAIALTLPDCVVISKDTDLLRIPGLTVENWADPS